MFIVMFSIIVLTTINAGKRKKRRRKTTAKHDQGKGHKTISKKLNVPLALAANNIKPFKVHRSVANLPGGSHKRKIDGRLNRGILSDEKIKEQQYPVAP